MCGSSAVGDPSILCYRCHSASFHIFHFGLYEPVPEICEHRYKDYDKLNCGNYQISLVLIFFLSFCIKGLYFVLCEDVNIDPRSV